MTELENKLVEKILEKLNMEELTDKIAEKAAELIVRKEYPSSPKSPWIEPFKPNPYEPFGPVIVMYGVSPTEFRPYTTTPYVTTSTTSTFVNSKTDKEDDTRR